MATSPQFDSLIASAEQSVEAGLAYFQGVGDTIHIKVGNWRPRDVLSHLLYWHQATVEGMESVVAGGKPHRIYASVDEMNARAIGRAASKNTPQMIEEIRQLQARMAKAARALPNASTAVVVFGDGSERSVQQRFEAIAHHWKEHLEELKSVQK